MSYLFMDESGDLGFDLTKRGTSKFFVVTLLHVQDKRPIEGVISRTYSSLKTKHKKKENILHSFRESSMTRMKVLRSLCEKDIDIFTICIDKRNIRSHAQRDKSNFYNFITHMLLDTVIEKSLLKGNTVELIASRRETNRFLNDIFVKYIGGEIRKRHHIKIDVSIALPQDEKCLQAVDFISWAIFRKYENGDPSYYQIVREKIKEEHNLLA